MADMVCLVPLRTPDNSILEANQTLFEGHFWVYSESESSNVWKFVGTYGAVAQLEERLNRTQEVVSSNLIGSTNFLRGQSTIIKYEGGPWSAYLSPLSQANSRKPSESYPIVNNC